LRRYHKQASSPVLTIGAVEINTQDAKVSRSL